MIIIYLDNAIFILQIDTPYSDLLILKTKRDNLQYVLSTELSFSTLDNVDAINKTKM